MKNLTLKIRSSGKPLYLCIADAIRDAIRGGLIQPDEELGSTRLLAEQLKVNRHTISAALDELVAEGWICGREKSRFSVTRLVETLREEAIESKQGIGRGAPQTLQPIRTILTPQLTDDVHVDFDFRSGMSDLREFPTVEFFSHIRASLRRVGSTQLGYGSAQGHKRLLDQLSIYLRRVRAINNRALIITHGSQEGIFIVAQSFVKAGDRVVVESLGYPPAFDAFRLAGAVLEPVRVDEEGMNCDDLERVLKKKKISLIYTTPLHQYPTTVGLSAERRLRLYNLASKYRIPILEDDYDHEFHYRSQPTPPLASDDPAGIVMYVSSFSKILLPSIRVGFLAVPPALLDHFVGMRKVTSRQNDLLIQEAIARWMEDGGFERHLRRMCRLYEQRRDFMANELNNLRCPKNPWSFDVPNGGMVIWLNTGVDSLALASRAAQVKTPRDIRIALDPEQRFRVDQLKGTHLRMGFAKHNSTETTKGLKFLAEIINYIR